MSESKSAKFESITALIKNAADRIVQEVEARRRPGPGGGPPLFVLLGEVHSVAAHRLAVLLAIRKLKEDGYDLFCGRELPCNMLAQAFKEEAKCAGFTTTGTELRGTDPAHPVHLKNYIAQDNIQFSRLSDLVLSRYLLREKIRVAFNDIAIKRQAGGFYLDLPRQSAARSGNPLIDVGSSQGMHLRNRFMAGVSAVHAETENPDLYLQLCGRLHVGGSFVERLPYGESLTGIFEREGRSFVAIPLGAKEGENLMPPAAQNKDCIVADICAPGREFMTCEDQDSVAEQAWLDQVMPHLLPDDNLHQGLPRFIDSCAQDRLKFFQKRLRRELATV